MSTGLAVFDTTIQQSNEWLKEIESHLQPCNRQQAYDALRAVLHVLRDHLPFQGVIGLSAQLPMLLRGVLLEGWRPPEPSLGVSPRTRNPLEFAQEAWTLTPAGFPREPIAMVESVFRVLADHLDPGETRKLQAFLPGSLRPLWPPEYRAAG